jgi:hypothetical protein
MALIDTHCLEIQGKGQLGFTQIWEGEYIGVGKFLCRVHFYPPSPPSPLPVSIYDYFIWTTYGILNLWRPEPQSL